MQNRSINKGILFLIFFFSWIWAYTQPRIEFEKTSHDFGEVIEGNKAKYSFQFTNTGDSVLYLESVKASCGCTTPYWTQDPIPPGESGKITASYNSKGRPGPFHKSVYVRTNVGQKRNVLRIKGIVKTGSEAKNYTEEELKNAPKLVFEQDAFNFGQVEKGQEVSKHVNIKNLGRSDLNIKGVVTACRCVSMRPPKSPLKPGESAKVKFIYKPKGEGNVSDVVHVKSNDLLNPRKKIEFKAKLVNNLTSESMIREDRRDVPFK